MPARQRVAMKIGYLEPGPLLDYKVTAAAGYAPVQQPDSVAGPPPPASEHSLRRCTSAFPHRLLQLVTFCQLSSDIMLERNGTP